MKKNNFSKYISLILILIMLINYLQLPMNFVYGAVSYSGQTVAGNYTISTKEQLNLLAQTVNSGTSYIGSTFTLTNNIVYESSVTNNYIPIGKSDSPFKGNFDGNGFSIGGINISQAYLSDIGIFGCIDSAYIVNLNLINSTISALNNAGGIVGNAQNSTVKNCSNNSTITGANPNHQKTTGIIGGIVGYGYKTVITDCTNNGKIYGLNIGGIAGELKGVDSSHGIFNSINNGVIEHWSNFVVNYNFRCGGGIVGRASNIEIKNCKNTKNIISNSGDMGSTGGIVGVGDNIKVYFCTNSYSSTNSGGITGYINNSLIYGCVNYSSINVNTNVATSNYAGGISSIAYNSEIIYCANRGGNIDSSAYYWDSGMHNGGIVGYANNVKINFSYNTSNVSDRGFDGSGKFVHYFYLGGIVGFSAGSTSIKNSYNVGFIAKTTTTSEHYITHPYPIGGANVSAINTYYLDSNVNNQEYTNIGQRQTADYMKLQTFIDSLNIGTGGTNEKDIKNPFVKTTQNSGYPIFWYEQKIESMVIDSASTVAKDNTIILKVITVPENITGKEISWTTSDSSIAEILTVGNGKAIILKGVRKGSVTITAKATDGSNKVATKTINVVSGFAQSKASYILVGEEVEYRLGWKDSENDPLFKEEFRYIHTPDKLNDTVTVDNTMGLVDYNNQWQNNKFTQFSKVGTYKIQYRVQDNPPTANKANFENYRYYSDKNYAGIYTNIAESIIYVHRKPIALYTIATNGSLLTDYSYDLDHSITHGAKGIAKWEWKCISNSGEIAEYTETNKTTGVNKVNAWISIYRNLGYKIVLRVQDIEGAWSEPTIKGVGEYSKPVADFSIEKNSLIYPENQTITDLSYDTNGLTLSYKWTVYKDNINIMTSTNSNLTSELNTKIKSLFPNVIGDYSISLQVINSAGVESSIVIKNFKVIVTNQAPIVDFELVSNESPVWNFPKILGLYTLRYKPTASFFYEEKTKFNVNVTDPNTDNSGFIYDWKLERFAVKNINNISGAAANTYSYTTQYPFTNSFKGQGLPWGAYRITLSVTDKPPIPPYASGDAKKAITTKQYYIVPELSLTGSFESASTEIMVGDTITLKAKTSKETENVICILEGTTFTLNKSSEDSGFAYWEKNITIPESITESGKYQLQFVGNTTYGGNGSITREVRDTVSLDIVVLKLINFRITGIVNHPHISFPQTKDMLKTELIPYKAGYYVTFRIDSKGKPDQVYGRVDIGNNGSVEQIIYLTKVVTGETETWQGRFYTSSTLSANTVISIKLDCNKGATVYDYNLKESWNGRSLITNGSALMDGRVNLTN